MLQQTQKRSALLRKVTLRLRRVCVNLLDSILEEWKKPGEILCKKYPIHDTSDRAIYQLKVALFIGRDLQEELFGFKSLRLKK